MALGTPSALADGWFPHPAGALWQYRWSDSTYNPGGTLENLVVQQQHGSSFTLAWADPADKPPPAGSTSISCPSGADLGTMSFQDSNFGLINTNWDSCPAPSQFPILCATTSCANSLSSALYNVIWGNRLPVLQEPLLAGTTWTATGGASNDVTSTSTFLGMQVVKVPAFPGGVQAAVIRSYVAQAGAIGDPYGSGVRLVWWVYGVGPVRVAFDHAGGSSAPVTNVFLEATNLHPQPAPPTANLFPYTLGAKNTYRWTNDRHLTQPEIEQVTVGAVANNSARLDVKSVSGPIRAVGNYIFTTRLDGVTNTNGQSSAATLLKLPRLGHGRHFFTPLDLMTYGFNPLLPAYPKAGDSWQSGNQASFRVFGVTGSTRILGLQSVHVPAGTFNALAVTSTLTQKGFGYGSGVRTMWFAPGRGLVKLTFRHRDGSTTVVELIK